MPKYRHPERYLGGGSTYILIEHDGKVAGTWGWELGNERPVEQRKIYVSYMKASHWPELIGKEVHNWNGNVGQVYFPGRPMYVDTTGWKVIEEERPFKKPRDGRRNGENYTWKWEPGHFGGYAGAWVIHWLGYNYP